MVTRRGGKAYYMISAVASKYDIHPQTLRLYEREGLLTPSRTEGNTRLYSEEDLEQLETILSLTRELGVNLAGVEVILNMRKKMERMQAEVNEFMEYVKKELARGLDDWEQRLSTAMVKSSPTDLVKTSTRSPDAPAARRTRRRRARAEVGQSPNLINPQNLIDPTTRSVIHFIGDLRDLRRDRMEGDRDRRGAARHALRLLAREGR